LYWRCAGEGELVLTRIHLAHILPAEDELGKPQFLPVFYGDAPELTAQYIQAFEKVWAHRTELAKA